MRWFEELMSARTDPSEGSPGGWERLVEIADATLDGPTMAQFVREFFIMQKRFGEFLGVGESTVAGWMKAEAFPDYACRAALAAYFVTRYSQQLRDAELGAAQPQVVRDGERYLIVQFRKDETGVSVGDILARDIVSERAALVLASGPHAWELLREAEQMVADEIESRNGDFSDHLVDLRNKIRAGRGRAFNHQGLLKGEREKARREAELGKIDLLFPTAPLEEVAASADQAGGGDGSGPEDRP